MPGESILGKCDSCCGEVPFACESLVGTAVLRGIARFTDQEFESGDWTGVDLNEIVYRRMDLNGAWKSCYDSNNPEVSPSQGITSGVASGFVSVGDDGAVDYTNASFSFIDEASVDGGCHCDEFTGPCAPVGGFLFPNVGTALICGGDPVPMAYGDGSAASSSPARFCSPPRAVTLDRTSLSLVGSGAQIISPDQAVDCSLCTGGGGGGAYPTYSGSLGFVLSIPDTLAAALERLLEEETPPTAGTNCMTHVFDVGGPDPISAAGRFFWRPNPEIQARSVKGVRAYTGLALVSHMITVTLRRFEPDDTATVQIGMDEEVDVFFTPDAADGEYRYDVPVEVDADVLLVDMTEPVPA